MLGTLFDGWHNSRRLWPCAYFPALALLGAVIAKLLCARRVPYTMQGATVVGVLKGHVRW